MLYRNIFLPLSWKQCRYSYAQLYNMIISNHVHVCMHPYACTCTIAIHSIQLVADNSFKYWPYCLMRNYLLELASLSIESPGVFLQSALSIERLRIVETLMQNWIPYRSSGHIKTRIVLQFVWRCKQTRNVQSEICTRTQSAKFVRRGAY